MFPIRMLARACKTKFSNFVIRLDRVLEIELRTFVRPLASLWRKVAVRTSTCCTSCSSTPV